KNAAPLFQVLGLSRPGVEKLGALSLTGKAASGKDSVDFDLAINLTGAGGKGSFKGKLTGLAGAPQVSTDLKLDATQPAPLLALAGFTGPMVNKLGALGLAGHLEGGTDAMKLALTLSALGGNASVNGNIAAAKSPIAFDVTVGANHPNLANLLAALGKPAPKGAGGALSLNVRLTGDTRKFAAKDLSLKAGDSDLAGNANVDMSGSRPQFAASFASNNFNVAAFAAGGGGGGGGGSSGGGAGRGGGGGGRGGRGGRRSRRSAHRESR